jgi:hypothetical protein
VKTAALKPAAAVGAAGGAATGRRRAVLALARVEAVRLLRHPITLAAVLFLVAIWVSGWLTNEANRYPVLQDTDRDTQLGMMLLLGGAALIVSNLAVLRAHRNGTTALSDVLVLPYPLRTAAHLLAVLPLGLVAVALTGARVVVLAMAPAAGRPNPFELATGPVIVLLFGALGILFGRLTRSPVVAPLAVLGLLAILIVVPLLTKGGPARWFQPVVPEAETAFILPAPVHLMARPAGPHLVYLAGLAVVVAAAALARSGARTARVLPVAAVALVVTVAGGITQTAPPGTSVLDARVVAVHRPASQQTCQQLGQVTYCAFPDFTAWIPGWDAEVRGVLRRVPAAVARRPLAVRQRILTLNQDASISDPPLDDWTADDLAAGTPNAVTVGTRWGDSRSATRLTGLAAYRVVTGERPGADPAVCGARGVLVAWLAGQASPQSNTGLHKLAVDQRTYQDGVFLGEAESPSGIYLQDRQLTMALTLLDRPADEVGARVLQSWDELTAADTPTERAAEILGVPAPPPAQTESAAQQDNRGSISPRGKRGGCS